MNKQRSSSSTASNTVLVTGATGSVGRHVVDGLRAVNVPVRALSRHAESAGLPDDVDVRQGDLQDPHSLMDAFEGIRRLYLFPAPDIGPAVAAAKEAGVEHVVLLSSASAELAETGKLSDIGKTLAALAREHRNTELSLEQSGLSHTVIRPGPFMGNDLVWAPEIIASGTVSTPLPEVITAPVDERDVADAAVTALCTPSRIPSPLTLTGPEELSQRQRVELISSAIGREVNLIELTPLEARDLWADFPDEVADHILETLATTEHVASVRPALGEYELTRRPYLSWLRDQRMAFLSP